MYVGSRFHVIIPSNPFVLTKDNYSFEVGAVIKMAKADRYAIRHFMYLHMTFKKCRYLTGIYELSF
jgi:hypothetical protein